MLICLGVDQDFFRSFKVEQEFCSDPWEFSKNLTLCLKSRARILLRSLGVEQESCSVPLRLSKNSTQVFVRSRILLMSLVVDQEYSKLEVVGIDTFADRACKKRLQ